MTRLLIVAVLVALIVAVVIGFLRPLPEPIDNQADTADVIAAAATDRDADPAAVANRERPSDSLAASGASGDQRAASVILPEVQAAGDAESFEAEARRVVADLLRRYPDTAAASHVAGLMHAQVRETEAAQKAWARASVLAPDVTRYRVNLATVALERGRHQAAIEALQGLVEAGSEDPDVLYHYALALTKSGRFEESLDTLEAAIDRYPNAASLYAVRGQSLAQSGDAAGAVAALRRAMELGAESADLYFQLSSAYRRLGDTDRAAEAQAQFEALKPDDSLDVRERFAVLSAAEARGTALAVRLEAANVAAEEGDAVAAEVSLLRAIALNPGSMTAYQTLARVYRSMGRFADLSVVFRRLTELQPGRFEHYLNLAQVQSGLDRWSDAEASLKLALAMQPDRAIAYVALAEFYYERQDGPKSRWFARQATERFPSEQGYEFLAKACLLDGDRTAAEDALRRAEAMRQSEPTRDSDVGDGTARGLALPPLAPTGAADQ